MCTRVLLQRITRRVLILCLTALPLAGALATSPHVQAASYTFLVNSNEWFEDIDKGDGICKTGNNNCTLRAATQEASALGVSSGGADTITINLETNTYPMQGTLNPGNATVIINGNGSTLTGVFGASTADYRLFMSSSFTGEWLLSNLILRDSTGGGIYTLGTGRLSVVNCSLTQLSATTTAGSTSGGAITTGNNVRLTVMGSNFDANSAQGNGGAISHGHGPLFISNTTFANNAATLNQGGGLFAASSSGSSFELNNVTFRNNLAAFGGGLYIDSAILIMTGGEVRQNTATADGGGLALSYTKAGTVLDQVRITGNTAGQEGGGLLVDSDTFDARLLKSTVSENMAPRGGGLMVLGGRLDIEQSAVVANTATGTGTNDGGAGIRVINGEVIPPVLSVINSTLSGNVAHRHGGGLYVGAGAAAYLSSATVTENVANEVRSSGAGGGFWNAGTASLANTIVAGNLLRPPSGGGLQLQTTDVAGNLVSRGYNLIGTRIPTTSITGDTTGNLVGSVSAPLDAGLGARSTGCGFDYIASVPAHSLLQASIAINAANPAGVRHVRPGDDRLLTVDQCGAPRVQQGRADMGALESPHAKPLLHRAYLPLTLR